jgi:hypothetical protein
MTLLVSALLLSANQICLTIPLANASWVQVVDVTLSVRAVCCVLSRTIRLPLYKILLLLLKVHCLKFVSLN